MSRFTNYFSKHVRERFTKEIELIGINRRGGDFIFTYKVLPFINIRVISNYNATVLIDEIEHAVPCEYNDDLITVRVSEAYFNDEPDNLSVQLYSFNEKMRIKRSKDFKIRTQYFVNNKLYNIKVKRDVHISKRYMTLNFTDETQLVNDANVLKDSLVLTFNTKVDKDSVLFLSYIHKFVEIPTTLVDDYTLKVTGLEQLTNGEAVFYIAQKEDVYLLKGKLKEHELFTEYYSYTLKTEPELTLEVKEHVIVLESFYVSEIKDNVVTVNIQLEKDILINQPKLSIFNPRLDTSVDIDLTDQLRCDIPIGVLIDGFTNKKINFINDGIVYQLDIRYAKITDDMVGKHLHDNEYLNTHFYRRKDNYLGFKVSRPRIRRRMTSIKDFTFKGFMKGRESFSNAENVIIFEDRISQKTVEYPVDDKFKIKVVPEDIINLMSRGKTVIDIYVGMRNEDGDIIAREKIPYKHSDYKKDNFYDLKIVQEKDREVYLLVTTTPFNNLKVETFVVPKSVNTNVTRDNNIWLLGERTDTAQENGYALFKYLQDKQVEAYYVIDGESKDYEKIKDEENVLVFGSEAHYDISLRAGVLLCTHDFENILPYKPAKEFFNYGDTFKVFLQHGVLGRKPAEYHKKYYEDPFDIFIVSSSSEKYDVVVEEMGYDEDEVIVTGLARFDQLPIGKKGKDILLMPTWRDWINTDERFLNSEYYHRYKNLIENERLHEVLKKYNVKLNFYPHYRAQQFFTKEHIEVTDNIEFITLGERTVQDLLIEHVLLITDFSSVSFDFTMMKKPVIYYHFDEDRFFNRGILRPVNETFLGDITETEELLISYIEDSIKHNYENKVKDISGIIKYQDQHNCERIYEAVERKKL